jgi:hypothetical protein
VVPRSLGWLEAAGHLMPRRVRERAQDAFGLGAIATDVDVEARRGYETATIADGGNT